MNVKLRLGVVALSLMCGSLSSLNAQSTRDKLLSKIEQLKQLMVVAEAKGIDLSREDLALNTAELFLDFSDYDQAHPEATIAACETSPVHRAEAQMMGEYLPEWERGETILLLEETIEILQMEIDGEIKRAPVPKLDWSDLRNEGNKILNSDGDPVYIVSFGTHYTEKNKERYSYYGDMGGFYCALDQLDEDLKLSKEGIKNLKRASKATFGYPFIGHGRVGSWMSDRYPEIVEYPRLFTKYDMDHPKVREYWDAMFEQVAPIMKGSQSIGLGYMLANEPHWHTAAKVWDTPVDMIDSAPKAWDTGGVSKYTMAKFRVWLEQKHTTIDRLNEIWATDYSSFEEVSVTLPMDNHLLGSAEWYDWMKFNQWRVTDWFEFLTQTIQKYDPGAVSNVKVMNNLWTENKRDHGLDFEAICELSGVTGNDAATYKDAWGEPQEWEKSYMFEWREMLMGYDLFRSISPDKTNLNSEVHYLMHSGFQHLELSQEYTRCAFWLSTIFGCDANNMWVWTRVDDDNGNYPPSHNSSSHIGTVCTQPRVLNETMRTFMELNAHGWDIDALQTVRQPIRIFYSETSAINKRTHMDDVFELYEELVFMGTPLGFATERVINNQDNDLWDVIVVRKSEHVTVDELKSLQRYLDNGGTIITDNQSLATDEYKVPHDLSLRLTASRGRLVYATTLDDFVAKTFKNLKPSSYQPLEIEERNMMQRNLCVWRSVDRGDGRIVLSLANIGNRDTHITIKLRGEEEIATGRDLLTGVDFHGRMIVKPEEVVFVELGNVE